MLQLIRGLHDKDIQEKVLAAGAALEEGAEMSLHDVVKLVEAAEVGKGISAQTTMAGGGVFKLSDHRKNKDQSRLSKSDKSCRYCGRDNHARDKCPAKD